MTITLQPKEQPDKTLPYPYFISKKGLVGRQDYWKGKPYKLIGFSKTMTAGNMTLYLRAFLETPEKAIGMFPIFADKKDNWATHAPCIESVKKDK